MHLISMPDAPRDLASILERKTGAMQLAIAQATLEPQENCHPHVWTGFRQKGADLIAIIDGWEFLFVLRSRRQDRLVDSG
jgi:hypothetical protein